MVHPMSNTTPNYHVSYSNLRELPPQPLPEHLDLEPLHTLSSVGYELSICLDYNGPTNVWWVRFGARHEGWAFTSQAAAICAAANMVLSDCEDETGIPEGTLSSRDC